MTMINQFLNGTFERDDLSHKIAIEKDICIIQWYSARNKFKFVYDIKMLI
mgnify:CR=1 FL=1